MTPVSVRALTVRQPWADAIMLAGKNVENRTWSTPYQGWVAIHAGGTVDSTADPDRMPAQPPEWKSWPMPRGVVLGVVWLAGVHRAEDHPDAPCSPWAAPTGWHWTLTSPALFGDPPRIRGRQGLFTLTGPAADAVRELVSYLTPPTGSGGGR